MIALPRFRLPQRIHLVPLLVLVLIALLLGLVLRLAPPLFVDLGEPGDSRFISGFYQPEFGAGETFRWSGPEARLLLHGATPAPSFLRLRLNGERLLAQGTPSVVLQQAEVEVARFDVQDGWRTYTLLLPPDAVATTSGVARPLNLVTAVSDPGVTADDLDFRPLGVPVAALQLERIGGIQTPAFARAAWLTWMLALVVAAIAWLDALLLPRQRRHLWQRASLVSAVGGALLLVWAFRDPSGLAWALPPTPWILGTATLLLAVVSVSTLPILGARVSRPLHKPNVASASGVLTLIAAMALLAVAVGLLNTQLSVAGGLILALVALMLMAGGPYGLGKDLWTQGDPDLSRKYALVLLGLTLLLALGLRFYRLDELPFGLWRDEARHGMFAQLIRDYADYRPIYIASDRVNMPALGLYPFALALHFWGENLWSMRVVSGLAGALTVLPLYGFATWLSGRRSIGLLAALLLAVSSWHITVSRLAFPTVFDPLLTLSGLWLLGWGLCVQPSAAAEKELTALSVGQRIRALLACLLGGVCLGLAVQTYHTGRMAPIIAAWLALLLLLRAPRAWRGWLVGSLAAAVGLLLTVTPLLLYAFNQPEAFNDRVSQVFLLSEEARLGEPPLRMLDTTLRQHLLMFHGQGDLNGRHHAPGRPMLDYVTGIGMLLGVAGLLRYPLDWRSLMLAGALALGLVPSALAVNGPHGLRGFSAAAFAFMIAAVGWVALWQSLKQRWPAASRLRWLTQGVGATLVSLVLALNATVYFVLMPPQREVFLVFYPVQSQMGAHVRELAEANGGTLATQVYVPEVVRSDPVFAFLTTGLAVQSFAGAELSEPAEPDAIFLLSGYFAADEADALAPILGVNAKPTAEGPAFPDGQGVTFYVYKIDRTARIWSGVVRQHPPMSCAPSAYQVRACAPKSALEHSPDHDRDATLYSSPEFG